MDGALATGLTRQFASVPPRRRAVWLGLLLAGVAVGLVTRTVSRREVR
jgi:hypothetical protein